MLAIARALVARPKLLMLDEPSLGLAPQLVRSIFQVIREINREGTTILLVEQNANMALQVANRAYVIEVGKIRMEGPAAELAASDESTQGVSRRPLVRRWQLNLSADRCEPRLGAARTERDAFQIGANFESRGLDRFDLPAVSKGFLNSCLDMRRGPSVPGSSLLKHIKHSRPPGFRTVARPATYFFRSSSENT